MSEHTPGPWSFFNSPDYGFGLRGPNDEEIVYADYSLRNPADGPVLAAAPVLLELVETLLEQGSFFMAAIELHPWTEALDGEEWEKRARAAVAKAKGEA